MAASPKLDNSNPIPREAPAAPTQAEWDRLSDRQRQQVKAALECSESQEELDELDAMSESDEHYDAKDDLRRTLRSYFGPGGRVYVGAERKVFYPGRKGFTPDLIVVVEVSPHKRDSWMVSHEGRGVDVIIEVFYKGNWRKDFVDNVAFYAEVGVPEYFIFDAMRKSLTAYRLPEGGGAYVTMKRRAGRLQSEKLGLDLGIRRGQLRFFRGTAMLPTPDELISELEEVAEQEQARAEQEQARAERTRSRLAAGVLAIASARGQPLTEQEAIRVHGTEDGELLARWMERAATMTPADLAAGRLFEDS